MKLFFVFFLIIVCIKANCQQPVPNQDKLLCKYNLVFRPDSLSTSTKNEEFLLVVNDGMSLFKSMAEISKDSLANVYEKRTFNQENGQLMLSAFSKMRKPNFAYAIYKTVANKAIIYCDKIERKTYLYKESTDVFSWRILNENAVIAGYKCQKAVTKFRGRVFEAWFTREIPVSEGPYKFCGLPGLIVKINDSRNSYVFTLKSLKQSGVFPIIAVPTQVITTTKKEYDKGKADYAAGALDRVAAMGNAITTAEKQQFKERMKKRNNPLELN